MDYNKFSLNDLKSSRDQINREKYPEKYQAIIAVIQEKENEVKTNKYDTFTERFFAGIIDGLILLVPGFAMLPFLLFLPIIGEFVANSILNLLSYAYIILLHGFFGQTLGKMIMKVKVVNNEDEKEISMKQAFIRDVIPLSLTLTSIIIEYLVPKPNLFVLTILLSILSSAHLIWFILEIVTMFSNKKRRALHDFIAGTVVIRYV